MAVLVLVTGAPGSGKTTFARRLSQTLGIPLFYKDRIKEFLFEALSDFDQSLSKALGRASYPILYTEAEECLKNDISCILESNFKHGVSEHELSLLLEKTGARCLQILCVAPAQIAFDRARMRWESGERHSGHQDNIWLQNQTVEVFDPYSYKIDISGDCLELDFSDFGCLDYAVIFQNIRRLLQK